MRPFKLSVTGLLILLAVIPLALLGFAANRIAFGAVLENASERLLTVSSVRQNQIDRWIDALSASLYKTVLSRPELPELLQNRSAESILPTFRKELQDLLAPDGFTEIILVGDDDRLLFSTNSERYIAPARSCPPRIICSSDFFKDGDRNDLVVQYPILGNQQQQVGALVGLADTRILDQILGNRSGLQQTGIAYLLGADGQVRWIAGIGPVPQRKVDGITLRQEVSPSAPRSYPGVSSVSVQGMTIFIPRMFAWLVVEQAVDEINQPVAALPVITFGLGALVLFMVILAGQWQERRTARSREQLSLQIEALNHVIGKSRATEQARSRALANMGHELRTPINSILNFSGFLMDGLFGQLTGDQLELIRQMHTGSQHLLDLINDLLDMSQIEAGQMRLFIKEFELAPLMDQTIATLRSLVLEKPIAIRTDFPQTWPVLRADRRRVFQILLNLVSNAAKFTERGSITLRAHTFPTRIEIRVEDTGPGIAAEFVPVLFEPFKQDAQSSHDKGGSGLGLALSRYFARMHGGDLIYQPGEPGGAVFIVSIPLDPPAKELSESDKVT